MARRAACQFTQAGIARTLRAYKAVGIPAKVVLHPDGRAEVVPIEDQDVKGKPKRSIDRPSMGSMLS